MTGPISEVTGVISALTTISIITILIVLLLAGLVIAFLARSIARPIRTLEAAAVRIADGDISLRQLGITANDEVGRLGHKATAKPSPLLWPAGSVRPSPVIQ